jgi:hypothetical protein
MKTLCTAFVVGQLTEQMDQIDHALLYNKIPNAGSAYYYKQIFKTIGHNC